MNPPHETHEKDMAVAHVHMAHTHAEAAIEIRAEAIKIARDLGCSWEQLGDAMGMSRQTAHKRFANGARNGLT